MDVHSPIVRSYNMSSIRGKDTRAELLVRRFIHARGFRYSLHSRRLPGKPDIVLSKYKTIIDIRGCFWHLHQKCKYGACITTPSKIISSRRISAEKRDMTNELKWKELGWNVIVIWAECELEPRKRKSMIRNRTLEELLLRLRS